jgi:protein involved in polysaccharide export with SLBB domain
MLKRLSPIAIVLSLAVGAAPAQAQQPAPDARRVEATRQDLQALLTNSKLTAEERRTVETRLRDGDFEPGDRIHLRILGDTALTDTFTVRPGRILQLPNIPDISLQGVLRSEFPTYLRGKLLQYLRDPQITATPLVRLAVLGAVNRPGFYVVPATTLASDVVMAAGGPAGQADIAKAVVRRGAVPVIDSKQMRQAFADGVSIDQLNLHSGDEFVIGEKSGGVKGALQTAGLISGILLGIFALTRI